MLTDCFIICILIILLAIASIQYTHFVVYTCILASTYHNIVANYFITVCVCVCVCALLLSQSFYVDSYFFSLLSAYKKIIRWYMCLQDGLMLQLILMNVLEWQQNLIHLIVKAMYLFQLQPPLRATVASLYKSFHFRRNKQVLSMYIVSGNSRYVLM